MARRLSDESAMVLRLFLELHDDDNPSVGIFGRQIIEHSGIKSGSLYPILHRLEERRLLLSDWEDLSEAVEERRRPRCRYRLNPVLADEASQLVSTAKQAPVRAKETLRLIRRLKAQVGST